ncbi:glycerate kinase [uncultured Arthrobacter sp.]|uniref:glycerate kinase n=1 Tax=uncultured Arthrobacter sp. TaxID=114050 RepID=UPI00261024DB|nr:glycerate kinase [uncultured Arthrobacter sp.]
MSTKARVLIAPDKFKGSLTATEVAAAVAAGIKGGPGGESVECTLLPLADGGDGSVGAAVASGFRLYRFAVAGPTGEPVVADVAFDGETAVVEVANSCGIALLDEGELAPLDASSRGFGEAIVQVSALKPRRIAEVQQLDAGLTHFVQVLREAGVKGAHSLAAREGVGSAGGIGFACLLLGAAQTSGADFFLDLLNFDSRRPHSLHFVYNVGMATSDTTTVRVRRPDSERLHSLAKARQTAVIDVLHAAIDALERQEFLRGVNEDYQRLQEDPERWEEYLAERREWDTLA